jgi:DNA polymerase III alpha subunit
MGIPTIESLHPLLDEVLAETHGIMVYQEDVMKVAVALGGFSVEDGDQLQKGPEQETQGTTAARLSTPVL